MSRLAGSRKGRQEHRFAAAFLVLLASLLLAIWMLQSGQAASDLSAYPWLYLRDGESLAAGEQVVELIAVGDVMLGRGLRPGSGQGVSPGSSQGLAGEPQPFAAAAPWLRLADLTLGNLECVIAQGGSPRPGPYRLRAPPSATAALRGAGFDLLGLANNHTLDFGPQGLAETVAWLREAGIATVGAGPDSEAAARSLIRELDGVRLAFLAFNAVPDPEDGPALSQDYGPEDAGWARSGWDRMRATAAVAAARTGVDAVVVSIHWGYEYDLRPDPAQREAAQALLDAGADLVIGHHPHVVQGTRVSGNSFVAYSLGNFVFDQEQEEARRGLALRAFFDVQGLRAVQALPLWAGFRPRLMTPDEAASLLGRVQPAVRRIGFACDGETCRPADVSQAPKTGQFRAGALDLTGDGVSEQVRRLGEQVVVYHHGVEAWRGLPEWRVVDLAMGDPNDDGRQELLLALWKPDAEGMSHSHPFIVGYREGAYRILWGGSPAADPICEVELGDVDGNGVQELVVLEEQSKGRVVTVWRWHGWGFSLVWRSPPGSYQDLALIPSIGEELRTISVAVEP